MGISPYFARLRALVGNELLVVPSTSVLVRDDAGRLLLVRQADTGLWATIGGAIEPGEAPEDGARREALEEAGVVVQLRGILAVVGGPGFEITYGNGDRTAYVSVVYDAVIVDGTPTPDHDETVEVAWFTREELAAAPMGPFTTGLLDAVGAR